jgi:MFS family permease
MYLASRLPVADGALADPTEAAPTPPAKALTRRAPVSRNVYMLGLTSMFTDVSSEMVASVLPLYFVTVVGFSPALFGLYDGVYRGAAVVLALGAAVTADRSQRHKRVAGSGYGLSAASRLGLVAAGGAWAPVLGWLIIDRLGKGIRTAPRDALISLSSTPSRLGASFGVHRSLDTLGAVLGPLAATLLLARNPDAFNAVFLASFFVALLGFGMLTLFVTEPSASPVAATPGRTTVADPTRPAFVPSARHLLTDSRYRALCLAVLVLALVAPGDALLLLALERRMDLDVAAFPLLFFGVSVVFLVSAAPIGRLADQVGRVPVLLAGQLLLAAALAVVGSSATGLFTPLVVLTLVGVHYAATDGILMAIASSRVPAPARTTGLAVVLGTAGVGHLVAAATFGIVWSRLGPQAACQVFAVGVVLAVVVARGLLYRSAEDGS